MSLLQQIVEYIRVRDLTNTPGFIYGLAYFGSLLVYISCNPRKHGVGKMWWKLVALELLLNVHLFLTRSVDKIWFVLAMIIVFIILCAMVHVACDMNFRNTIYYAVRVYTLGEFAASMDWQIFYYLITQMRIPFSLQIQGIVIASTMGAVFTAMFFLEKYINRNHEHLHVEKQELLTAVIIGLFIYGMSNLSYMNVDTPFSTNLVSDIFIIRTLVDFAGVCLLTAYQILLKETHARLELNQAEVLYRMQYANYQISRESINLVNQKYHDLKHQIALLKTEMPQPDKVEYLNRMEDEIRQYEAQNKTGNEVLDIILTTKNLQCQKLGIVMTCVADGRLLKNMDAMDISSLFGSALDNAIAAVQLIKEQDKRLIHVMVAGKKGFIRIIFENVFEGKVTIKNGLPVIPRIGRREHLVGIRNMREIADKYGGSFTVSYNEGWMGVRILIPVL